VDYGERFHLSKKMSVIRSREKSDSREHDAGMIQIFLGIKNT